jgi:hypothetical protein
LPVYNHQNFTERGPIISLADETQLLHNLRHRQRFYRLYFYRRTLLFFVFSLPHVSYFPIWIVLQTDDLHALSSLPNLVMFKSFIDYSTGLQSLWGSIGKDEQQVLLYTGLQDKFGGATGSRGDVIDWSRFRNHVLLC